MSKFASDFLRELEWRGFILQCTNEEGLDALMASPAPITAYIGFDCTADSLHVGSLVQIMLLRWLQQTGHRPIVLMGGGTTRVGDPSGKDEARRFLTDDEIARNMASIKDIFAQFLSFGDGPSDALMVNNADWLDDLNYIAFLRDYGRHFSVNRMLSFDSVKLRLEREHPLTFLEFNYMILQAYDFLELARRYGCTLQMGGSDQWGNIVNGVELGRRVREEQEFGKGVALGRILFGLTSPLITTASGEKMGKTAVGAVWLNEARLSAYDYYQYWRNTEDPDVGRFLRLFTELPQAEIRRLESLQGADINEAKKILAFEATRLCRGEEAARAAADTARRTFEEGTLGSELPTIEVKRARLAAGIPAFELWRETGLCASNSDARRLIKSRGARVNDSPVEHEMQMIGLGDLNPEGVIKLSAGKKRHALVRAT